VRNSAPVKIANEITATPSLLENAWLRVRLDAKGAITSVVDKVTGREFAAGHCNALRLYKDVPSRADAWDIDSMYKQQSVPLDAAADISVVAAGPLEGVIRVTRSIARSTLTQEIALRADSRRIDFRTVVDWRESHRLLKVNFPVNVHANDAIHGIQFGHLRRPTHASRQFDADRFEVSNHKWTALAEEGCGAAVLNDCKYGVNVEGNTINLTLLRSPLMPDMTADKGVQEFTYALYVWSGALADSGIVRQAYDLNVPVTAARGNGGTRSLFSLDAPNVVIETVKPAEDGSRDVVVRVYEAMRTRTTCTLATALSVKTAEETNMLEADGKRIGCRGGRIALAFRPFEIKTLRLKL